MATWLELSSDTNIVVARTPLSGCGFVVPDGSKVLLVQAVLNVANQSGTTAALIVETAVNGVVVGGQRKRQTLTTNSNFTVNVLSVVKVVPGDLVDVGVRVATEVPTRVVSKEGTGVLFSAL